MSGLSTWTLIRALERSHSMMRLYEDLHGTTHGIAVRKHPYAILWQRRRRQHDRFLNELERRFKRTEEVTP